MKNLLLVAILFFAISAQAKKHEIPGKIVKRNETIEVTLIIQGSAKKLDFDGMMNQIQYLDKNGKKVKLKPNQAKEVHFKFLEEDIHLYSKTVHWTQKSSDKYFLQLVVDGKMKLYKYYKKRSGSGTKLGSAGPLSLSVKNAQNDIRYFIQKSNRSLKRIKHMKVRKDIATSIYDCPELKKNIEDNKWARKHSLPQIVEFYNEKCGE